LGSLGGWPGDIIVVVTREGAPFKLCLGGPASGRMLPHYWKDTCLFSPSRGPLRLDFYSTHTVCIMTEAMCLVPQVRVRFLDANLGSEMPSPRRLFFPIRTARKLRTRLTPVTAKRHKVRLSGFLKAPQPVWHERQEHPPRDCSGTQSVQNPKYAREPGGTGPVGRVAM
jgi:hypothetical protein